MKILPPLFAFVALSAATSTHAASCWVDKVWLHGDGVAVKADHSFAHYDGGSDGYTRRDKTDSLPSRDAPKLDAIPLDIGDSVSLGNSGHDTCTLTATVKEGVKGLTAGGFFFPYLPGAAPKSWEEFIPAEAEPPAS